jgi:hypothetical protein
VYRQGQNREFFLGKSEIKSKKTHQITQNQKSKIKNQKSKIKVTIKNLHLTTSQAYNNLREVLHIPNFLSNN